MIVRYFSFKLVEKILSYNKTLSNLFIFVIDKIKKDEGIKDYKNQILLKDISMFYFNKQPIELLLQRWMVLGCLTSYICYLT